MIKRISFLIIFGIFITGCSKSPSQLSYDSIKDLSLDEQVDSVIENTKLIEGYKVIIDDKSVAIVYPSNFVPDSWLVLSQKEDSFPIVAMTLVEHLKVFNFDEVVINAYEPSDLATGFMRVSALFTKQTIEELDFGKWKEEKKDFSNRFYRYSDAYLIRSNIWEKLEDDTKNAIQKPRKDSDSPFWEYYGSIIE